MNNAGNFGSPTQLLILLAIVLLLFGGKRLRTIGGDLGTAIKGFKNSMEKKEDHTTQASSPLLAEQLDPAKDRTPPNN